MTLNIKDSDEAYIYNQDTVKVLDVCCLCCNTSSFLLTSSYQLLSNSFSPQSGPFFHCHAALPLTSVMPT